MPQTASELELKSKIASALKRQHYLGGVPGAQRLIPLAAFAVGDVLAHKYKTNNKIEDLLCEPESTIFQLSAPLPETAMQYHAKYYPRPGSVTIVDACLTCSKISPIFHASPLKYASDAVQYIAGTYSVGTLRSNKRLHTSSETSIK